MLRVRRGNPLALNRSHPAARGANFLAVSNGGPTLYDIITRQPSTNTNAPTGARDPFIGNASTFANNTKLSFAGRGTTAYTACTWAVLFKLNASNAGVRTIASDGATPGTTGSAIRIAGGGGFQFRPNTTSVAGTLTLVTGGYYFCLGSFVQSAAGSLTSVVTSRIDTNELNVVTGNVNVAPVPGGTIALGDANGATAGALMDLGFVFQSHNYTPLKQLLDWAADPFSIFEDDQNDWLPLFSQAAAAGITGDAAWTEAQDSLVASGTVSTVGNAAWTETQDALAATGTLGVFGTAAWTEAQDSLTAAGTLGVFGDATWTETQDSFAASGTIALPTITGDAVWTEAQDTIGGDATNGNIDTHDPGLRKRLKKAEGRRRKEFEAEADERARRRTQVIQAFESVIEGKPEIPAEVADEIVAQIEEQAPDKAKAVDFQSFLDSVTNVQRLWDEYLERDDEEVLTLL